LQWLIVEETKPTLTVHKDQEVKSTPRLIDEKGTSLEYNQLVFKKILRIRISNYLGFIYKRVSLIITIVRFACKTIGYYCWIF
jgi:hypothetical protein